MAETKGKITGSDDYFFTVGKFKVEIATEICIFGVISNCCAHN